MTTKPYVARVTYKFNGDLLNSPKIISTVQRQNLAPDDKNRYFTITEGLPVLTFRAGSVTQDIVNVYETFEDADKGHEEYLKGGK